MKRKTIYLGVFFLTFLVVLVFASFWHSFSRIAEPLNPDEVGVKAFLDSETKAADLLLEEGLTFKGTVVGCGADYSSYGYRSSDGMLASASSADFQFTGEARESLQKEVSMIKPVYKSGMEVEPLGDSAKLIGIGQNRDTGEKFASIAYLKGRRVEVITAPSLRYALAFEKSQ